MRKILIGIIIFLLIVLCYNTIANGLQLGGFKVLSIKQVEEENKDLKDKIEESNRLIDIEFKNARDTNLTKAKSELDISKKEYLKYINSSSNEQIINAKTDKSFAIEFLWTKLGVHAREEGVNITFEIVSSATGANNSNDIKFTVEGSYIAITNFIYSIENDSELDFRIENFDLLPNQNEILKATFNILDVAITGNTSTQMINNNSSNQDSNNQSSSDQSNNNQSSSNQTTAQQ